MASDDTMTFQFHSSLQEHEDFENDTIDHHHHPHPNNLSRLSVCTSSTLCGFDDEDDDVDTALATYVSGLSIESFEGDGDADGEFSDGKELPEGLSSDSENELRSCYSMPGTPPRRRNYVGLGSQTQILVKDYASDNEVQKGVFIMGQKTKEKDPWKRRRRCRKTRKKGTCLWDSSEKSSRSKKKEEEDMVQGLSWESDQSGSTGIGIGIGLRVITRPKGGRRSLCMDLEEVKACRDLGFELEHERMFEMPSRLSVSISNSTLDTNTSSGGNSPIANWRISSPGDDPRDVKARLKMWAQAVAASASKYGT